MLATIDQLKCQAQDLSAEQRSDLICFLLETLEPEGAIEQEWKVEISRRVAEIRSGQAVGRPLADVLADLRKAYP